MRHYETLYLLNPNLAAEEYTEILGKFNGIVEKEAGVVIRVEEWGKRTLAYEVRRFDKGYYVLMDYCGGPGITDEFHRAMRLDDRVFKFHTVKLSDTADPEALKAEHAGRRSPGDFAPEKEETGTETNGDIPESREERDAE